MEREYIPNRATMNECFSQVPAGGCSRGHDVGFEEDRDWNSKSRSRRLQDNARYFTRLSPKLCVPKSALIYMIPADRSGAHNSVAQRLAADAAEGRIRQRFIQSSIRFLV